jgi:hypothetical protein
MVILGDIRRNRRLFPLFPYLLIYHTEEVAGSNPARSTIFYVFLPLRGCCKYG